MLSFKAIDTGLMSRYGLKDHPGVLMTIYTSDQSGSSPLALVTEKEPRSDKYFRTFALIFHEEKILMIKKANSDLVLPSCLREEDGQSHAQYVSDKISEMLGERIIFLGLLGYVEIRGQRYRLDRCKIHKPPTKENFLMVDQVVALSGSQESILDNGSHYQVAPLLRKTFSQIGNHIAKGIPFVF